MALFYYLYDAEVIVQTYTCTHYHTRQSYMFNLCKLNAIPQNVITMGTRLTKFISGNVFKQLITHIKLGILDYYNTFKSVMVTRS